jgi:hypothetical protein
MGSERREIDSPFDIDVYRNSCDSSKVRMCSLDFFNTDK